MGPILFTLVQLVLDIGLIQIVGIIPTLILAQVGLGRASGAKFTSAQTKNCINSKANCQASMSQSTPVYSIYTKGHVKTVLDVAGRESDSERHLDLSTAHCLQSKEKFTLDDCRKHEKHPEIIVVGYPGLEDEAVSTVMVDRTSD